MLLLNTHAVPLPALLTLLGVVLVTESSCRMQVRDAASIIAPRGFERVKGEMQDGYQPPRPWLVG